MIRQSFALLVAAALGACVSILPDPPPAPLVYRLIEPGETWPEVSAGGAMLAGPLEITRPVAPRELATDRLTVVDPAGRLAVAAGARWAEPAPDLLHRALLGAFEAAEFGAPIVRPTEKILPAHRLTLDLLAFEAETSEAGAPQVLVSVRARLLDARRQVVRTEVFTVARTADATTLDAIAAAHGAATRRLAADLVAWTAEVLG